ncbi:MAG: hypothetical protein ACP5P3_08485 [Ignavibacteria bacterium]
MKVKYEDVEISNTNPLLNKEYEKFTEVVFSVKLTFRKNSTSL